MKAQHHTSLVYFYLVDPLYIAVICAMKHSLTCVIWRHFKAHIVQSVHVTVMCVMKLLVCRFNWRYIFTYIVINVYSSVVSAINHLLISVKWIHWFINSWILHISGIYVLKISVCCRNVINNVRKGCCIASLWKVRGQFQNQPSIGWLKKYKIVNKTLLYGSVTYITALLLRIVFIHI